MNTPGTGSRGSSALRWAGVPAGWVALAGLALVLIGGDVTPRAFAAGVLALAALEVVGRSGRWTLVALAVGGLAYASTVLTWAGLEADLVDDGVWPVLVAAATLAGLATWSALLSRASEGAPGPRLLDETGALSMGWGRTWLEEAIERACRSGETLAVLVAQVEGGAALSRTVAAVSGRLRATDRVVRFGPANLALIVPGFDVAQADALARELRLGVAAEAGSTVRFGVAAFPHVAGGAAALLEEAEQALTFARLWDLGVASATLLDPNAAPGSGAPPA